MNWCLLNISHCSGSSHTKPNSTGSLPLFFLSPFISLSWLVLSMQLLCATSWTFAQSATYTPVSRQHLLLLAIKEHVWTLEIGLTGHLYTQIYSQIWKNIAGGCKGVCKVEQQSRKSLQHTVQHVWFCSFSLELLKRQIVQSEHFWSQIKQYFDSELKLNTSPEQLCN